MFASTHPLATTRPRASAAVLFRLLEGRRGTAPWPPLYPASAAACLAKSEQMPRPFAELLEVLRPCSRANGARVQGSAGAQLGSHACRTSPIRSVFPLYRRSVEGHGQRRLDVAGLDHGGAPLKPNGPLCGHVDVIAIDNFHLNV